MSNTYLENLTLSHFMGYKNVNFNFMKANGDRKPICLFFGPNGTGKSTALNAIMLACNAPRLMGRDNTMGFRKLVFNEDFDPTYQAIKESVEGSVVHPMKLLAQFKSQGKPVDVELNNQGVVKCDLAKAGTGYYIDADNQMNLSKFQFHKCQYDKDFIDMAHLIYNFPCEFNTQSDLAKELGEILGREAPEYYTDFIVTKYGVRTHFKSMSGGEKKIATMLTQILDPTYIDPASIVVIDSFEKEIYFKRQGRAIDKMLETFPDKQFFVATHSETLINHVKDKYGEECWYDIEQYKIKDLGLDAGYIN